MTTANQQPQHPSPSGRGHGGQGKTLSAAERRFPLAVAQEKLARLIPLLDKQEAVHRLLVCGSIRRGCPHVHDADIVIQPANINLFGLILHDLMTSKVITIQRNGPLIKEIHFEGLPVDIYIASDITWGTLTLIRTGSKEHNIRLAQFARSQNIQLKADGSGLLDLANNQLIPINCEQDIFHILNIPFKSPRDRS